MRVLVLDALYYVAAGSELIRHIVVRDFPALSRRLPCNSTRPFVELVKALDGEQRRADPRGSGADGTFGKSRSVRSYASCAVDLARFRESVSCARARVTIDPSITGKTSGSSGHGNREKSQGASLCT